MKRNDRYTPLSTCLFDAFTEPDKYPTQDDRQNWAIYEGLMRRAHDLGGVQNLNPVAKIEHTCVRGCKIQPGESYFKYQYYPSYGIYLCICATCAAMILYFSRVEKLGPYMYTHWDEVEKKPIKIDK